MKRARKPAPGKRSSAAGGRSRKQTTPAKSSGAGRRAGATARTAKKKTTKKAARTGVKKATRMGAKKATRKGVKKHARRGVKKFGRPVRKTVTKGTTSRRPEEPTLERLQKILAAAGVGSRRVCEELITAGRVEVDRKMVTELGTRVNPTTQEVRLDGVKLKLQRPSYYAVNKPVGTVSTSRDPAGRPRVIDLIGRDPKRLFAVGRLDISSEGLILVTNDGELANRLTHPRYEIEKVYHVQVAGRPERETLAGLCQGIRLAEGIAKVERVTIKSHYKESTTLEMILREGRNREIRRVLAKIGHKVMRLVRVAVGPVRLGTMPPGEYRKLTAQEVRDLRQAVGLE